MGTADFRQRMLDWQFMAGTFLKTPSYEMVEVLAKSGLDFICLDGEHAPFDRGRMDACLAIARALDFPVLVRVGSASAENILQALDSGAVGIVAPHIDTVERPKNWREFHGLGIMGGAMPDRPAGPGLQRKKWGICWKNPALKPW